MSSQKSSPVHQKALSSIIIEGAREHNLKNLSLQLPHHQLIVVTGPSGSGKSSLVFDILYVEGHHRYMDTLESNYVRKFIQTQPRPSVDQIKGLPAVIGIHQGSHHMNNSRSTVGTNTEIYAFLRLLFAKIAKAYSYKTSIPMQKQSIEEITLQVQKKYKKQHLTLLSPLIEGRKGHYEPLLRKLRKNYSDAYIDGKIVPLREGLRLDRYKNHTISIAIDSFKVENCSSTELRNLLKKALTLGKGFFWIIEQGKEEIAHFSTELMDPLSGIAYATPSPNSFSFNSPFGACPTCQGLGRLQWIDSKQLITNEQISLEQGAVSLLKKYSKGFLILQQISVLLEKKGYQLSTPLVKLSRELIRELFYGKGPLQDIHKLKKESIVGFLYQRHLLSPIASLEELIEEHPCSSCEGKRLKKEALYFKIGEYHIADLAEMNLEKLQKWLIQLPSTLTNKEQKIVGELLKEMQKRLQILLDIGLEYLSLNRPLETLSGGELQRIRLGTQIGTQLVGVLYILDEPSIGLHVKDNAKILSALRRLQALGNTVIVIEHDKETMLAADYLIEIGPKAGKEGGYLVGAGTPKEFLQSNGVTAQFLKGVRKIAIPDKRKLGNGKKIILEGCSGYNLKNITLTLPLGTFICITGVSGAGKSTLIEKTLLPAILKHFELKTKTPLPYKRIQGLESIDKVIAIDQHPIGRTPRSNPATYTGLFTAIRQFYSQLPAAKAKGYNIGQFSFNVKGGRCENCKGAGLKLVEMDFLPSLRIPCVVCQTTRYNRHTKEIKYHQASIADVLKMTVKQAYIFFNKHPSIQRKLGALLEVGLDYITLGQHATTLSGGEAQRIKLASELAKRSSGKTLYLLNEPSTGLHFKDIEILLHALQKLVDQGNTVVVIEHNMDIIKVADYIIDIGPEGGEKGGMINATGSPEALIQQSFQKNSTAGFLAKELLSKA